MIDINVKKVHERKSDPGARPGPLVQTAAQEVPISPRPRVPGWSPTSYRLRVGITSAARRARFVVPLRPRPRR